MKKQLLIPAIAAIFLGLISFTSCQKTEKVSSDANITAAQDDALSEDMYNDVYSEMDDALTSLDASAYAATSTKSAATEGSRTVTVSTPDSTTFPKTITIEFVNWTDAAGRVKNGKIIIVVTGRYREIGATKTVTFDNFTIDDNLIEGTKTVENLGRNEDGNLQYRVTLVGGKVTTPDGKVITRESERIRTWVAGEITPHMHWDDMYMIEGSASGTDSNGDAFSRTILNPLFIVADCPWIAKGTAEVVRGDKTMTIDYGGADAVCDNNATVTVNGVTKEIKLHRGKKRVW